jgi:hypothetical protein
MNRGVRLLCGLAVVMTHAACGGDSTEAQPQTSLSEQTTVAEFARLSKEAPADENVQELTAFRSPSSNIGCYLIVDYVRCDIDERNWSAPPRPADCEFDYGQGITMVPRGSAEFVCAGDTALVPDGDPLPYGQSIAAGPLRCDSEESGITCRDTETGKGFSISHDAYQLF